MRTASDDEGMAMSTLKQLQAALLAAKEACDIEAAADVLGHNVLHVSLEENNPQSKCLDYINEGETYASTICHENGLYWIGSWGNWYEEAEHQHCEDNDVVRCGWCSEFTPLSDEGWRETTCEACRKNVDS